jgi:hypothetical protein
MDVQYNKDGGQDKPPEITPAMIDAGIEALEAGHALTYSGLVRSVYLAMAAESRSDNGRVGFSIPPE